jgi:hypothetical protein
MLHVHPKLLLLTVFLLLSACSGTYRAYTDMLKLAFTPAKDVAFTFAELTSAKHDYLYVRVGNNSQVALGLAVIEDNQFKWVSGDRALMVTEHGRVVRSSGLANDLLYVSNTVSDPIKRPLEISTNTNWIRVADWQQDEYGYQIRSHFEILPTETMQFFGVAVNVIPVVEYLQYQNEANFVRLDRSWQNTFYLDAKSGVVLKSKQLLAPGMDTLELIFISEIVRNLKRAGAMVDADAV